MFSVLRVITAGLLTLAAPVLIALTGLSASAALEGVAAQGFFQPQYTQHRRRHRERSRGRERGSRENAAEKRKNEESETGAKPGPPVPPGMQHAVPTATFGEWSVYTSGQSKAKVCYAIANPRSRSPKTLTRESAYLFVTARAKEAAQPEIAVMFGFQPKPAASQSQPGARTAPSDPYLLVGGIRYGLVVKNENAWVLNQAEEAKIVGEMSKNSTAAIRTVSTKGSATSDDYPLEGFPQAIKRVREECR